MPAGLVVPEDLIETLARRVADLVSERLEPQPMGPPWLDEDGAALYASMTRDAISGARKRGQLRSHRSTTGRIRYHRDDLDAFLRGEA